MCHKTNPTQAKLNLLRGLLLLSKFGLGFTNDFLSLWLVFQPQQNAPLVNLREGWRGLEALFNLVSY